MTWATEPLTIFGPFVSKSLAGWIKALEKHWFTNLLRIDCGLVLRWLSESAHDVTHKF